MHKVRKKLLAYDQGQDFFLNASDKTIVFSAIFEAKAMLGEQLDWCLEWSDRCAGTCKFDS